MNPTTRRFPRTLNEAFGTNTSPLPAPSPWTAKRLVAAVALTIVALGLSFCVPTPAHAQFMSAGNLAEHIESQDDARRTHAGYYIIGVFDAYKDSSHCAPPGVTLEQLLPFAGAFVINNPQLHDKPADHVLGYIFSRTWPCANKPSGRERSV